MSTRPVISISYRCASLLASVIVACSGFVTLLAAADDLRPADQLVGIDSDLNVTFTRDDQSQSMPLDQVNGWGALGELRGRETFVLTDGSLLSGSVLWIDSHSVAFGHDAFDPGEIPRQSLRGVVLRRPASDLAFDRLVIRLGRESFADDTLLLENGDTISGSLLKRATDNVAASDTIAIDVNGTRFDAPLERITAVAYRTPDEVKPAAGRLRMGLRKGDLLQVKSIAASRNAVTVTLAAGVKLSTAGDFLWPEVTYLSANASNSTRLTDLSPLSYKHLPRIGWQVPLGRGTNVLGGRLRAGGEVFSDGLGMPGSSRVAFRLDGTQRQFTSQLAVDDAALRRGSVVFRIFGKTNEGKLTELHTSKTLRGGDPPQTIDVDIGGVTLLVLLVDAADRGDELDYANWLDARIK